LKLRNPGAAGTFHDPSAIICGTSSSPDGNMHFMAHIKISLILESGARIGPGKAALLESVRDTGRFRPRRAPWAWTISADAR
jgi:hypothetical protein